MLSDGVYDMLEDKWLKGPTIVTADFNPYENFADIADEIRSKVRNADELFGELKRDVIDYEIIANALEHMKSEDRANLLKYLVAKLQEIEKGIEDLCKEREDWALMRQGATKDLSVEQAEKDIELAKGWRNTNAIFKFIARYKYIKVIKNLKELLADDQLKPDEIEKVKSIMGVNDE
jgi:phage host-nuclease inhibitor protein Gam